MRIGFVTTSWPSVARPWAGHFVASLAEALAGSGHEVTAIAPSFAGDGALLEARGVTVRPAPTPGPAVPLRDAGGVRAASVLWALGGVVARTRVDVWLAHWWPTVGAIPPGRGPVLAVLHGSDVERLAHLREPVRRALGRHVRAVAVAEHLAVRWAALTGAPVPPVCHLGAEAAEAAGRLPLAWELPGARVLTVARRAPGKGLEVAREAARMVPGARWLIVSAPPGLAPVRIGSLAAAADLVVVPSEEGPGLPGEGRPYTVIEAFASGTPVVGGPNHAVQAMLREAGQRTVTRSGPEALAEAVRSALEPRTLAALKGRALGAAARVRWASCLPAWEAALEGATRGS